MCSIIRPLILPPHVVNDSIPTLFDTTCTKAGFFGKQSFTALGHPNVPLFDFIFFTGPQRTEKITQPLVQLELLEQMGLCSFLILSPSGDSIDKGCTTSRELFFRYAPGVAT